MADRAVRLFNLPLIILLLFTTSVASNQIANDKQLFEEATGLFQSGKILEAVSIFKKLSGNNNDEALFYLGKIYYHGDGLDENKPLAFNYFKQASSNGHRPSLFMLAIFYVEKCSDFESCNDASKYFEESTKGPLTD